MNLHTNFNFKNKKVIAVTIISVALALLIFEFGALVGYHQARFSYRGAERYMQMMDGGGNQFFVNRGQMHGASGRIVSVSLPSFTVVGPDNTEKNVLINKSTIITKFKGAASSTDIQVDDFTVVLGEPNDSGSIDARFVRLMPGPRMMISTQKK